MSTLSMIDFDGEGDVAGTSLQSPWGCQTVKRGAVPPASRANERTAQRSRRVVGQTFPLAACEVSAPGIAEKPPRCNCCDTSFVIIARKPTSTT